MLPMLNSNEVCRRAGVSYRMLDYWTRRGALRPLVGARGTGTQRRWAFEQVAVTRAVARLAELGAGMDVLGRVAEYLEALPAELWRGPLFVSAGGVLGTDHAELDGAYVVNLETCVEPELACAG